MIIKASPYIASIIVFWYNENYSNTELYTEVKRNKRIIHNWGGQLEELLQQAFVLAPGNSNHIQEYGAGGAAPNSPEELLHTGYFIVK